MVRTRNRDISAEVEGPDGQTMKQPHGNDTTREPPAETPEKSDDPTTGEENHEPASKANDRMARFKALQARAVSAP